jgi:probable HAF family extracellular repeat protein
MPEPEPSHVISRRKFSSLFALLPLGLTTALEAATRTPVVPLDLDQGSAGAEYDVLGLPFVASSSSGGAGTPAINNIGEVAAHSVRSEGIRAERTSAAGTTLTDLGILSGGRHSLAVAINNRGDAAGRASRPDGRTAATFFPRDAMPVDLTTGVDLLYSEARGINDSREVVGLAYVEGVLRAFFWGPGAAMRILDSLGDGEACDINNAGLPPVRVCHLAGDSHSGARAISERGDVAGWSGFMGNSQTRAVLHTEINGAAEQVVNLGVLGAGRASSATAVNIGRTVVGYSYIDPDGEVSHAFVWTPARGMRDLNDLIPAGSGWELLTATGVNDRGQITGVGKLHGQVRLYRLDPLRTPPDPLPPRVSNVRLNFGVARLLERRRRSFFLVNISDGYFSGRVEVPLSPFFIRTVQGGELQPDGSWRLTLAPRQRSLVTIEFRARKRARYRQFLRINNDNPTLRALLIRMTGAACGRPRDQDRN